MNEGLIINYAIQQCCENGIGDRSFNFVNAGEAQAKLKISSPAPEWAVPWTALKVERR